MLRQSSINIQILRGLAIIAVVFIHNTPSGLTQIFVRPFLNFSVGLFLFLSGLLTDPNKLSIQKRLKKVLIPYIVWTAVYVILFNHQTPSSIPWLYIKNLLTANSAPMMYYIAVYCQLTLLVPVINKFANSKYKYLIFLLSPIEIIVMRTLPILFGFQIPNVITSIMHISFVGWFDYYYLGYLIGNKKIELSYLNMRKLYILLSFSIILQIGEGFLFYSLGSDKCGTQLKLSSMATGMIFCLIGYCFITNGKKYNCTAIKNLGDKSFGIYFSHIAVMRLLGMIPFYLEYVVFPINAVIVILVTYFFVLVGSYILGKHLYVIGL